MPGVNQGEILVLPGSASGCHADGGKKGFTENTAGCRAAVRNSGERVRFAGEDGDYNHDGYIDLYVAAAGKTVAARRTPAWSTSSRGGSGVTTSGSKVFTQSSPEIEGGAQANAWYGSIT